MGALYKFRSSDRHAFRNAYLGSLLSRPSAAKSNKNIFFGCTKKKLFEEKPNKHNPKGQPSLGTVAQWVKKTLI